MAKWLCGYVAMWLSGYVAKWRYGYVLGHSPKELRWMVLGKLWGVPDAWDAGSPYPPKKQISYRKFRKSINGIICIVNCIERWAHKLRRIILLHFELIASKIHFRKTENPLMFMVFGPSGCDHDSPNQLCLTLAHGMTPNNSRRILNHFNTYYVWKSRHLGHRQFWECWKRRGPRIPEDPSIVLENSEYCIDLFQKTWNRQLVIWDQ